MVVAVKKNFTATTWKSLLLFSADYSRSDPATWDSGISEVLRVSIQITTATTEPTKGAKMNSHTCDLSLIHI